MGYENSGRRPNPNVLRVLKGEKNKNRYNPDEPQPPKTAVEKPERLSAEASRVWDEVAPILLAMGTLTVADVPTFAVYCEIQASFEINCSLKGSEGFSATREITLANGLRPYIEYFGMTPGGRARIRVTKPTTEEAPSKWAGALK